MAIKDHHHGAYPEMYGPARYSVAVTPADDAQLAFVTTKLWIGTGGDVALTTLKSGEADPTRVVFKNVPSGTELNLRVTQVFATGTTATDIVAMW